MRPDMKDVLKDSNYRHCEDTRYWERVRINRLDPDDLPKRIKHQSRSHYDSRTGALTGFLHSRVGMIWDDVYSEICAVTDRRSHRGYQLFKHLEWKVELNPEGDYYFQRNPHGFYVEDGILKHIGRKKYPQSLKSLTKIPTTDENIWYELIDGVWNYVVRTPAVPYIARSVELAWKDGKIGGEVILIEREYHSKGYEVISRQQIGRRTLKKLRRELWEGQRRQERSNRDLLKREQGKHHNKHSTMLAS